MSYAQANQAYTEAAVMSASREQLVVMMYDGAIRFLQQAGLALKVGNGEIARKRVLRADNILTELNVTLDMNQGEVADQLRSIYLFCKKQLSETLVNPDAAKVDQVIALLVELRESWQQVAVKSAAASVA